MDGRGHFSPGRRALRDVHEQLCDGAERQGPVEDLVKACAVGAASVGRAGELMEVDLGLLCERNVRSAPIPGASDPAHRL